MVKSTTLRARLLMGMVLLVLLALVIAPVGAQTTTVVKIYTSWPLTGGTQFVGESMLKAARLALDHYLADHDGVGPGGVEVQIEALDDASPTTGAWDGTIEAENAQRCVNDAACIVYMGTYNSGAAKVSMPITNEAGIAQISPANTYAGLTRACPACEDNEPDIYRPSGELNYFRVPVTDDVQGPAAASWAYCLGYDTVYVIDDTQAYGKGVADEFAAHAEAIGLTVAGHSSLDAPDADPRALLTDVIASGAELVFGGFVLDSGGPRIIQAMYDEGLFDEGIKFMAPDGLLSPGLIDQVGGVEVLNGNTLYTFSAPLPNLLTSEAGTRFYEGYLELYPDEQPDPYAVYAYTSMQVTLAALERAAETEEGITRATVLDAFRGVTVDAPVETALGLLSFDENGDSSLAAFYGYEFWDGDWANPTEITPTSHETCERAG